MDEVEGRNRARTCTATFNNNIAAGLLVNNNNVYVRDQFLGRKEDLGRRDAVLLLSEPTVPILSGRRRSKGPAGAIVLRLEYSPSRNITPLSCCLTSVTRSWLPKKRKAHGNVCQLRRLTKKEEKKIRRRDPS